MTTYFAAPITTYLYGEHRGIRQTVAGSSYPRHVALLTSYGPWIAANDAELQPCMAALNASELPAPRTARFAAKIEAYGKGHFAEIVERYPDGEVRRTAARLHAPGGWTPANDAELQACLAAFNALPPDHSVPASLEDTTTFYYPQAVA